MDLACLFSALFFLIANILDIVLVVKHRQNDVYDHELEKELDSEYLEEIWQYRYSISPMVNAANVFNALAWFLLTIPILQFAWIHSQGGKSHVWAHGTLASLAFAGAITELSARLLIFGATTTATWISKNFNLDSWFTAVSLDKSGWKSLELTFLIVHRMLKWVDAFEYLALFGCFSLVFYSVLTAPPEVRIFGPAWATLGLVIAFVSFIDFTFDVLRYEQFRAFSRLAVYVSFANTVILLPIWLLWFGMQLPRYEPRFTANDILFRRIEREPPIEHATAPGTQGLSAEDMEDL
uniref:Transmembrane protein n=1 Tax=Grammatophora oceanica TaxID=210454 RepID=A0A7S1VJ16_9STRA|mmetsp:Transcript_47628/g.70905  ORF Transcript_47628/g.70905 Transcript_47628/m.70905 type:complete len:294 (+) Transcript_47628:218-1099(+)|eukprot:CAMPEP_0194070684 /NCGR_PEP_ID=MMETSP0009_2-20130614/88310_1 /TAXON_ID=210454 /ORGANISM="Grammatophora oceanica, Strain CCMP 410" /LENGTH=293 /DNA_ID=CAMNT_0038723967 /DNA_START=205 /DNA_END=1086 /DNA_ORIENTATION=+